MKLSDRDIRAAIAAGRIGVDPPPAEDEIKGAALDLRLGRAFRTFHRHNEPYIDLAAPRAQIQASIDRVMSDEIIVGDGQAFHVHPGELALGVTAQAVTLPDDLVGSLNGRSSLARLGLMVHATAHVIDPGWSGPIVLEFFNCGRLPLALRPGMAVCAIAFEPLSSPAEHPYHRRPDAKYRGQRGAAASRMGDEP